MVLRFCLYCPQDRAGTDVQTHLPCPGGNIDLTRTVSLARTQACRLAGACVARVDCARRPMCVQREWLCAGWDGLSVYAIASVVLRNALHEAMGKPVLYDFTSIDRILMSMYGLSALFFLTFSMSITTSAPADTRPNTVCFPSSQGVGTVVMKNWEPACAMRNKAAHCL